MNTLKYQTNNYARKYFDYIYNEDRVKTIYIPYPGIFLMYSGKLIIKDKNKKILVKKGEYIFFKGDIITTIHKKNCGKELFCGIYIAFSKPCLFKFYNDFCSRENIFEKKSLPNNITKLPCTPYIQSLYVSLIPYLEWKIKPSNSILELKRQESIHTLLMIDEKFHSSLFDFINLTQNHMPCFVNVDTQN